MITTKAWILLRLSQVARLLASITHSHRLANLMRYFARKSKQNTYDIWLDG